MKYTEPEFQRELADVMKRHPCDAADDSAAEKTWQQDFEELLMRCTSDQSRRALDLYEIHVRNDAEKP